MFGVTTYFDAGKLRIYAFLAKNDNLYVTYWDGAQWKWANQGKPADTTGLTPDTPGVISYLNTASGKTLIYAFVWGANSNLYVNYWDGSKWQWANQGKPGATIELVSAPRAITYWEQQPNVDRIYAFAGTSSGYIYANYWDGTKWQWVKLPGGGGKPGVAWYTDPATAKRRIYVFSLTWVDLWMPTKLTLDEWDGSKWQGTTQEVPSFQAHVQHPAVISYAEAGTLRVYAFIVGIKSDLWVYYRDGSKWQWAQQGKPPGTEISMGGASSVTYLTSSGKQWIHVFVRGVDNKLYNNFWDGTKWQWAGYGNPPTATLMNDPTAITFRDPVTGKEQIYVFSQGSDGNFYVNYGDVSNRKWANLGKP